MEKHEKITKISADNVELEDYAKYAKERLILVLRGLSQKEMIDKINTLHLSDRSLDYLSSVIAMESEDYEICAAVVTIKNARAVSKAA